MTDLEYQDLAESALQAVEAACDRINDETDADIDNQRTGGMELGEGVREKKMRREASSYLTSCGLALRRFLQ